MKIAILGGSFDPIHIGHLWIAQQVKESGKVDQVWLMPNKGAKHWGKNLSESTRRYEMCRLAINDFNKEFKISDLEIWREFDFTYQTIDCLVKAQPDDEFFWIVGTDWDCTTFKNYETLKDNCKFIVIRRNEQPGENLSVEIGINLSSTMIRNRVKNKLSITGLVTQSVEKYIGEEELYEKDC